LNPEHDKIRGADASGVVNNPAFKLAMQRLGDHLDQKILACDPTNEKETQRVVLAKQILRGIERELTRIIQDGEVAKIRLAEVEKPRLFNRGH